MMNSYTEITNVFTAHDMGRITRAQAVWQLSDLLDLTLEQADQMITDRDASELTLEPVPENVTRGIGISRCNTCR